MDTKTLIIEGEVINDIPSFYDEINRVFMAGESWRLGPSLDALDDMLYGGYGAISGQERIILIWRHIEHSRQALGLEATRAFYEEKLEHPGVFNGRHIREQLERLEHGTGQTYFDIVIEIIGANKNIELRLQD